MMTYPPPTRSVIEGTGGRSRPSGPVFALTLTALRGIRAEIE